MIESPLEWLLARAMALTPAQIAAALVVVTALLLVVEERRMSLIPLLAQYLLLGLLVSPRLYQPIIFVRVGLGMAVCLVLYITAGHAQHQVARLAEEGEALTKSLQRPSGTMPGLEGTGPWFRLLVVLLGGLVAYSLWNAYALPLVPAEVSLTSYWLIVVGILLTLISSDPLRMGFGLLTCLNGFEGVYLFLEQSLMVTTLLGVVSILIALAIAACAETWLDALGTEAPA